LEEHESASGGATWACASCHRPPSLTSEQWHAKWTRDRQAAEAHLAAAAAAEPQPRDRLHEALARRAEANAAILKLERATGCQIGSGRGADPPRRRDRGSGGGGTPRRQLLHWH
jgi:hypothetical protein